MCRHGYQSLRQLLTNFLVIESIRSRQRLCSSTSACFGRSSDLRGRTAVEDVSTWLPEFTPIADQFPGHRVDTKQTKTVFEYFSLLWTIFRSERQNSGRRCVDMVTRVYANC